MTHTPTQEQQAVDIQRGLPLGWFGVSHGIDNYEEAVRLDEIVYLNAYSEITSEYSWWHITLILKSGRRIEMTLSPKFPLTPMTPAT
jgi:hypothetical protein